MPTPMLVRLKPFNPRRGYFLKTYVDGPTGALFREERGWYEVDDPALLERLRNAPSRDGAEDSLPAFDVCTREEAVETERRVRHQQQLRATASDPTSVDGASRDHLGGRAPRFPAARDRSTLTTADLPGNQTDEEPADEADLDSEDLAADVAASKPVAAPKRPAPQARKPGPAPRKSIAPGAPEGIPGAPAPGGILAGSDDE